MSEADARPKKDTIAGPYPPLGFYFRVTFDEKFDGEDAAFQEVGGIGPEMETESYREGGENRFVYALPKGVKHPKLTLKRGIASFESKLVTWCRETLEGDLIKKIERRTVRVELLSGPDKPLRGWSFEHAYPAHWSVDPFQSDKNGFAIEKIELNYTSSKREM